MLKDKIYLPWIAVVALLITGCVQEDSDTPEEPKEKGPEYVTFSYDGDSAADVLLWQPIVTARATKEPITAAMPPSIGVFGYNDQTTTGTSGSGIGEVFNNVKMVYRYGREFDAVRLLWPSVANWDPDNDWVYEKPMPWIANANYEFFAYSPYTLAPDFYTESSFGNLRTFRWSRIPRYTADDYMISSKIIAYHTETGGEVQKVFMKHLMSRLRFCFKLGSRYSDLRCIHVKSVKLVNLRGISEEVNLTYSDTYASFPAENNSHGYAWTRSQWTPMGNADEELADVLLYNDNEQEYVELTKANSVDFQPLASAYVFPEHNLGALTVEVVYDVFDSTGQLLRKDDSVRNVITLNLPAYDAVNPKVGMLRAGYYYDVNLTIEPKFLYVLSDYDLNADGFLVITE